MKRIAFALLALSLGGALAYSQEAAAPATPPPVAVTISEWAVQVFAIGNQDSSGYWAGVGSSWGNVPRIVGLNIQANYAYGGFSITPSADNGVFSLTDQNKGWVTPLPGLTLESGITLETDTWRGDADWGSDDWVRLQGYQQNSTTFFRLGEGGYMSDINYNKDGIGAWIGVSQPIGNTASYSTVSSFGVQANPYSVAVNDLGSQIQGGAAYTIPSGPQIKVQYVGYGVQGTVLQGTVHSNSSGTSLVADGTPFGQIQVAANLQKMIPGLNEEVGVTFPINASDAGYVFQASDMTDFTVQQVTLHLIAIITDYNGNEASSGGSGIGVLGGVGADYDLGSKVTLQGDLRYGNQLGQQGGASGGDAMTGFLLGVKKGFDHGDVGIGLEFSTSTIAASAGNNTASGAANAGDAHWEVPLVLHEYF